MRVIRVTGKGQIKLKPDITRIMMLLEGTYPDYEETLRRSSLETVQLKEILLPFGFESSDIKTLHFNVETEYEGYRENDVYKQRLIGYQFSHIMKVEFESDNELLGKILYALSCSDLKPEVKISYTVKNPEAAKNELLGRAVKDAKEKAIVLATAAGVVLKDIQNIDYSWGELDFEVSPISERMMLAVPDDSYSLDIEPDDIDVADIVTVVWEIE